MEPAAQAPRLPRLILRRMDPYQESVKAIVRDAVEMIQKYRERRELSHEELAKKAKIARTSAYNLKAGATKRPRMGMIARLWLVLEIPPDELAEIVRRHG